MVALLGGALSLPAWGDTFKCIDANGRATYTNIKDEIRGKSCTIVMREISIVPAIPASRAAKATPTPPGFPKVDQATQKSRDESRRKILEDELGGEEKALDQAKAEQTQQASIHNGGGTN